MITQTCEENRGGHSIHFLQRLERADGEAAELAIRLYHDPEILRVSLWRMELPKDVERVAVSLDPEDKGPYLVATATGRFVTCLGRGMSTRGLYFIPCARMLAHLAENTQWRERRAFARSLVGEGGSVGDLLPLMLERGDGMSKEEMIGLSALQPVLKLFMFKEMVRAVIDVDDFSRTLLLYKRFDMKSKVQVRALRAYWKFYFSVGHLALLTAMDGPRGLEKALQLKPSAVMGLFSVLLTSGSPATALRLAWFVGKMGATFLTDCKRMACEPDLEAEWLLGLLGLLAIGLRHSKLRSKVIKAIESAFKSVNNYPPDVLQFVRKIEEDPQRLYIQIMRALFEPEKLGKSSLTCARKAFIAGHFNVELPAMYTYKSADEVPAGLAMTHAANFSSSFHREPTAVVHLISMMPWVAECEAEDFYYPEDFLRHVREPWTPEKSIQMIECEREARGIQKTVTVEKTPGRNDPCPCGSGKKYKKCCISSH
jgi:hypothetical protein